MKYAFDETTATPLCEIMGRNNSDKGSIDIQSSWHNYTTFYYSIFKDLQQEPLRIFELGLGTNNPNVPSNMGIHGRPGASLYGWKEFFVHSNIFGADIDSNILFSSDRINTYYCDQTNPDIIHAMWNDHPELRDNFDIIIEDGLHTYAANVCFFENSIHKLKSNGYYIIEDIDLNSAKLFNNGKIQEWEQRFPECQFDLIRIPSQRNMWDNTLLVIHKK